MKPNYLAHIVKDTDRMLEEDFFFENGPEVIELMQQKSKRELNARLLVKGIPSTQRGTKTETSQKIMGLSNRKKKRRQNQKK